MGREEFETEYKKLWRHFAPKEKSKKLVAKEETEVKQILIEVF